MTQGFCEFFIKKKNRRKTQEKRLTIDQPTKRENSTLLKKDKIAKARFFGKSVR